MAKRFGSMQQLDDRALDRTVVATQNIAEQVADRTRKARQLMAALEPVEQQVFVQSAKTFVDAVIRNLNPPKKDGNKYFGEVVILLHASGRIASADIITPSGNDEYDEAVIRAIATMGLFELPTNPEVAEVFTTHPIKFWYDETSLAD